MLDTQEDVIVAASQEDALDYLMAKNIAETLHAHYPGHLWAVNVIGEAQLRPTPKTDVMLGSAFGS